MGLAAVLNYELPKTVTASHAEIERLAELLATATSELDTKDSTIDELREKIIDLENDIEEHKEDKLIVASDTSGAIHAFLDECERTGPLRYDVPQTERAMRTIVELHDVVGRNA